MSRYNPIFPNCSICVSFGSYLGILYYFLNVFLMFFFYSARSSYVTYRIHTFVSFKFIICISIIISSISFHLFDSFFYSFFFYYLFFLFYFYFSF